MALFQPTNITPDLKGGVKNGFILFPYSGTFNSVSVSWTVNGNSQMTAYQIDFFQNTAASTQTGTTGKITLGTPFSAISADGTQNRFTASVAFTLFSGTYIGTGTYTGKFKITMWWGSGANEYVEQRSLSVFEFSRMGELTIAAPSGWGADLIFTGSYAKNVSFSGNTLNWTRWYLQNASGEIVQDTGKVWGATNYTWSPDSIAPGTDYVAVFEAEECNGAELSASYGPFDVLQDAVQVSGAIAAVCDKSKDAVAITVTDEENYPLTFTGSHSYSPSMRLILAAGATATAEIPASQFGNVPWHFIWNGVLTTGLLFTLTCKDGSTLSASFDGLNFTLSPAGTDVGGQWDCAVGDEVFICFTTGNFTAQTTTGFQWVIFTAYGHGSGQGAGDIVVPSFTQKEIVSVTLEGGTTTIGFTVGFGTSNNGIKAAYEDTTISAVFYGPKARYPYYNFDTGENDFSVLYLGSSEVDIPVYRVDSAGDMILLGTASITDNTGSWMIYDYSALNGETYRYLILSNGEENGNQAVAYSTEVSPCFWNWDLIEAAPGNPGWMDKNKYYSLVQQFRFIGNVSTGSYTNRGARNIQPTFTPYPAVFRSTQNSRQGTLTGLIGVMQAGEYFDTNATEAALRAISSSKNTFFLKNRRGDFMKVAIAGEITMSVNDRSMKQEITANIPWVEIGPADRTAVSDIQIESGGGGDGE